MHRLAEIGVSKKSVLRALVVDADPVRRDALSRAIGQEYPVLSALGLPDALRVAEEVHPDFVVMGVTVPLSAAELDAFRSLGAHPLARRGALLVLADPTVVDHVCETVDRAGIVNGGASRSVAFQTRRRMRCSHMQAVAV